MCFHQKHNSRMEYSYIQDSEKDETTLAHVTMCDKLESPGIVRGDTLASEQTYVTRDKLISTRGRTVSDEVESFAIAGGDNAASEQVYGTPDKYISIASNQTPVWTPDKSCAACMICNKAFTLYFRRHHCRKCGRCICSSCAPDGNKKPIDEFGLKEPVRHCLECYMSPSIKLNNQSPNLQSFYSRFSRP